MHSPDEHTKDEKPTRPKTRGECKDGPRPCPWVSCRYHLQLDMHNHPSGIPTITIRTDPKDWTAETQTCALDVADEGEHDWTDIARRIYGRGRGEADRQQVAAAVNKLRSDGDMQDIAEGEGHDPDGKPRPHYRPMIAKQKHYSEDSTLIDMRAKVSEAYVRHVVEVPEIRDIPPESVDLLSLLRDIRERNGKPRPFIERRHRSRMVEQLPKTRQRAKEEKPAPEPVEWIDL